MAGANGLSRIAVNVTASLPPSRRLRLSRLRLRQLKLLARTVSRNWKAMEGATRAGSAGAAAGAVGVAAVLALRYRTP